jgi:hypothetical protein
LSDGTHILKPSKLKMFPFFKKEKGWLLWKKYFLHLF